MTIALMAKRHLLFIFSAFICLLATGQENDSTRLVRKIIPSIYIDYGKLVTIASNFETKYEGGLEFVIMEKLSIIAEAGSATLSPEGAYANGTYESNGWYYRIGGGFTKMLTAKNRIGLSFRYAESSFEEDGRIYIESPTNAQADYIQSINRSNLKANWVEMVFSSDQQILKNSDIFSVGLNIRLRMLLDYTRQESIDVYAIPGYGRSFDKTIPAANLFFKVNF